MIYENNVQFVCRRPVRQEQDIWRCTIFFLVDLSHEINGCHHILCLVYFKILLLSLLKLNATYFIYFVYKNFYLHVHFREGIPALAKYQKLTKFSGGYYHTCLYMSVSVFPPCTSVLESKTTQRCQERFCRKV